MASKFRSGKARNQMQRSGLGLRLQFKGLTLSNSSPVHLGSRGFFFEAMRIGVETADMGTTRTRFTFRVAILPPRPPKPPPPRPPRPPPPPPLHSGHAVRNRRVCHQRGTLVYGERTTPNSARRKQVTRP